MFLGWRQTFAMSAWRVQIPSSPHPSKAYVEPSKMKRRYRFLMRMYVSWLDGNPDKIEVTGSSPVLRTNR